MDSTVEALASPMVRVCVRVRTQSRDMACAWSSTLCYVRQFARVRVLRLLVYVRSSKVLQILSELLVGQDMSTCLAKEKRLPLDAKNRPGCDREDSRSTCGCMACQEEDPSREEGPSKGAPSQTLSACMLHF